MRHKRLKTVLATTITTLIVIGLVFVGGSRIRDWVTQNLFRQYVANEGVIADQVAADLENETASAQDKLNIAAQIPAIRNPVDPVACSTELGVLLAGLQSKLGNLGRVSAQDVFVCSVNKALIGVSGSKLGPYLPEIMSDPKHQPVLSRVILPPGATYAVALHVPVYDAKGQFSGTLGGALYLKDLKDKLLKSVKFAQNGFAFVLDDNGDVLYHPKTELIGKNLDSPDVRKSFSNLVGLQAAVAAAKAGHSGTVRYSLDGVEKVAVYRSAQVLPNHRWVVMATAPVADAASLLKAVGVDQAFWTAIAMQTGALMLVAFVVVLGTLRAIRLQESLAREKSRIQTMLASIGDGVIAIDREGRILLFNAAAELITGWSSAEAVGRPWREIMNLIGEHDRRPAGGFIDVAIRTGKAQHMASNTLLVRRDEVEVPVGDSAAPILDVTGVAMGVIIVFRDMTEERETARMKSDFAYASHQFRTPLTQAMTALDLAQNETSRKQLKEDLAMARIGTESAHRLATKMLAMADVDNGRVQVTLASVDVAGLLRDVEAEVREHLSKGPKFQIAVAPELKSVQTAPDLLKQIVAELLYNAADYGDGKAVSVAARRRAHELELEVHNTGAPISTEDQAQIFTRFFRGANKPVDLAGAGLGLYLVREYVK
ncbi:MAG TPA: cache domain-containing protein, partial [Candidatus Saccharimonadia bacterium]|nr:cache domain-containing protein [Candidatus Saccharimonadia bacterium]